MTRRQCNAQTVVSFDAGENEAAMNPALNSLTSLRLRTRDRKGCALRLSVDLSKPAVILVPDTRFDLVGNPSPLLF
jgi:hypothetical protein